MFRLVGGFALASIALALSLAAASDWPTSPAPMPRIVPLAGTDGSPQSVTIGEMLVNADWIAKAFWRPTSQLATSAGGANPADRSRAVSAHPTANIQVALRPALRRVLFSHQLLDAA